MAFHNALSIHALFIAHLGINIAYLVHPTTMQMASSLSYSSSFAVVVVFLLLFFTSLCTAQSGTDGYLHLRFYNHERVLGSGPNATVVYAVERRGSTSGAGFGNLIVYDNLLRQGVEPDSPIVGRNQGMGVGSSVAENSGLTILQLVFTAGEYNGSSIAVQGLVPVAPLQTLFERAITGGTGRFRNARGYLWIKTN
ncbi:dirigent protein 2-like [Zingiber officinale]|uniref:Dirigent protein n=1 Tax=Zingiber officinale TaxID=94328 RepID=A0A8J5G0L1_ZINOF|nr:dirigent protein 2-like [Zingiber officinale]KAG6499295.1 hypothetical protein ZIOFF_039052 [Zingiber officinale]